MGGGRRWGISHPQSPCVGLLKNSDGLRVRSKAPGSPSFVPASLGDCQVMAYGYVPLRGTDK